MQRKWFYEESGARAGPLSEEEFAEKIRAGKVAATSLVWTSGQQDWLELKNSPLASLLPTSLPPLPQRDELSPRSDDDSIPAVAKLAAPGSGESNASTAARREPAARGKARGIGSLVLGLLVLALVTPTAAYVGYRVGRDQDRANPSPAIQPLATPDQKTAALDTPQSQWPILKKRGDWQADVDFVLQAQRRGQIQLQPALGYSFPDRNAADAAVVAWQVRPLAGVAEQLEAQWTWWVSRKPPAGATDSPNIDLTFLVQNPTDDEISGVTIEQFDGECSGSPKHYFNINFLPGPIPKRSGGLFTAQLPMWDYLTKSSGEHFCMLIVGAYR